MTMPVPIPGVRVPKSTVGLESATTPSPPEISLRPWTPDDTGELLGWLEQDPGMIKDMGFRTPVQIVNVITEIFLAPNSAILAAELGEDLVGFVAATNAQADGSVNVHIGVAPQHRGVGPRLMREGLRTAFEDLDFKTLITAIPNGDSGREARVVAFDKRFGFVEPNAKILILTRARWEERNAPGTSGD